MSTYNFPPTSRYYGIPMVSLTRDDGEQVPYLTRRFLPAANRFAFLRIHQVSEGERMDLVASRELGDAEAFWRIADANDAMKAEDLAVAGRLIRITLPEGIPGTPIV